jgi:hypothetical protein
MHKLLSVPVGKCKLTSANVRYIIERLLRAAIDMEENPHYYRDEQQRPVRRGLLRTLGKLLAAEEGEVEVPSRTTDPEAKELDQHAWIQQQRAMVPRAKWEFGGPGIDPSLIEGVADLTESNVGELFGVVRDRINASSPGNPASGDTVPTQRSERE